MELSLYKVEVEKDSSEILNIYVASYQMDVAVQSVQDVLNNNEKINKAECISESINIIPKPNS